MGQILLAGAAGFVGQEVVRQILEQGKKVTALDRYRPAADIPFIEADLTDAAGLERALAGRSFDRIIHLASLPGDTGNPQQMIQVNVTGLLNLLEFARKTEVRRFVAASSISAYEWYPATKFNPPDYLPVDENHPCRPKDMYSTSKRMQELLLQTYHCQYGLPTAALRLTAVVGPQGRGGGRGWREFAEKLGESKRVQIPHVTAAELCHYVDVRDVARMLLVVAEHPRAAGEIFNCCGPAPTRGGEFIKIVQKIVPGIEVDVGFPWSMAQGGEISFSMEKAKRLLGFEPKYDLAASIQSIKDWIDAGGLEKAPPRAADDKSFGPGMRGTNY
jgi:nucleoside-diphosphate-sugar epimerase